MGDGAVIAIVSGFVSFAGLVAWLVYKCLAYANALQAMDDERDKAVQENASLKYELTKRDETIAQLRLTADTLAKEPHGNPNADLRPDDLDTRRMRDAEEAIAASGDPVSAGPSGTVHSGEVPSVTVATEVQPARPTDRLLDPDEHLL